MASYMFQDAKVGDVVRFDGHRLEVREQKGHCPQCFFHDKICSGIACTGYERTDNQPVYYKELKKKSK